MIKAAMDISGVVGIHPFTIREGKPVSADVIKVFGGKEKALASGLVYDDSPAKKSKESK